MKQPDRPDKIFLDFPRCIEREFPSEFPLAWKTIERVVEIARQFDSSQLESYHPALGSNDWEGYLRCSVVRMVRLAARLADAEASGGRVLEYGSWFGNFSLMLAAKGFEVDSIDSYRAYAPAFDRTVEELQNGGVSVLDFEDYGYSLDRIADGTYDLVLCLGIIEHIPHTPRMTLEAVDRVLKPGGMLVVDTPNLAYVYNRDKLSRGESVFPPIWHQYFSQVPFQGHHREYTKDEVEWMLEQLGHDRLFVDLFFYSLYSGNGELTGSDLENFLVMESDPQSREYIMAISRKGRGSAKRIGGEPLETFAGGDAVDYRNEVSKLQEQLRRERQQVAELQVAAGREIRIRDELLQDVQQQVQDLLEETGKRDREIQRRDEMLQVLQQQLQETLRTTHRGFLWFGLSRKMARIRQQLEASYKAVEERDREIRKRDGLLQEVQRQVQESLAEVSRREWEIQKRDKLLKDVQRQVNELLLRISSKEEEIAKRDGMLQEVQRQVQDSLVEVGKRESEIQKRDELLQQVQERINELVIQIQLREGEVQKRDGMLEEVQQQVQDSLVEITKREGQVVKRDRLLQATQRQIDDLAAQMRRRETELSERDELLGKIRSELERASEGAPEE